MIRFDQDAETLLVHGPCGLDLECQSWEYLIEESLAVGEYPECPGCGRQILCADELVQSR